MNAQSSDSTNDSSHPVANLPIQAGERREAFFGLIAPIGVDLDAVMLALSRSLSNVGYKTNEIRLTDIFRQYPHWYEVSYKSEEEKYKKYIQAGDDLRLDTGRDDILALYSIARLRDKYDRDPAKPVAQEVVHVFRQIKRVEEISVYKETFGRNILFISCYSPKKDRIANLVKKMLKSERGVLKTKLESKALDIIAIDEDERDNYHGQRVVDCYPHADFVLDCTNHQTLTDSAERLIEIYFGSPFNSPRKDEYASYIANAASYRSLDLSRQVGAAIFGKDCELISIGCNEVPRAGGGTYWSDDGCDHRDYAVGYDSNQKVRDDMTRDALVRLQNKGWLNERYSNLAPDELVLDAFESRAGSEPPLRDSMMRDIIEFGRMVHAEMNALADAARFRRSTIDATLYCTTMPCHMCAKLIIAAGIKKVVYIQPYTKSLVEELFDDSVSIDDTSPQDKVHFVSLKGVTPNGFRIAFRKTKRRKDDKGNAVTWDRKKARPTFLSTFAYYQPLEIKAVNDFMASVALVETAHPKQPELALRTSRTNRKPASKKAAAKKASVDRAPGKRRPSRTRSRKAAKPLG